MPSGGSVGGGTGSNSGGGFSDPFSGGFDINPGGSGGSGGSGGGSNDIGISVNSNKKEYNINIDYVSVNNVKYDNESIKIPFGPCILNWSYRTINSSIRQMWYEVRIGNHTVNWGNSNYMPNVYRQPFTRNSSSFWSFKEKYLSRGTKYYGQIRLKDNTNNLSEWKTFSFYVNNQTKVIRASIYPENPGLNSDLELTYELSNDLSFVKIRWYKNGEHQSYFDNYDYISKSYMRYLDVWFAEITPYDSIENGPVFVTDSVKISKKSPVASELDILPKYATDQDILEASYNIMDEENNIQLINDKSKINWYVNGFVIENASDSKCVKLALKPGDEVFYTIQPSDGMFYGETLTSPVRIIGDAGFRISHVRIDGQSDNINVSTVNPVIEWNVIEPFKRLVKYAKIDVGLTPGGSDVFSSVIETFEEKFVIPDNVIEKGIDYYVTVYSSDSVDIFENGYTSHFRVKGNRWNDYVNNSNGWTILTSLKIDGDGFHYLSIADGSRFSQIRFYSNKIELLSTSGVSKTYYCDLSVFNNIIICGKNNDIKIYVNNQIVIDGSSLFNIVSYSKYIEYGHNDNSSTYGYIKYIYYTTKDSYYPDSSDELDNIVFTEYVKINGHSVDGFSDYDGDVAVSINPINVKDSGFVYKISEKTKPILASTENVDNYKSKIYSSSISIDQSCVAFGYAGGASIYNSYNITKYDVESSFVDARDPSLDFWEKIQTTKFESSKFEQSGLVINTSYSNIGSIDNVTVNSTTSSYPSFIVRYNYQSEYTYDYYVYINNGNFILKVVSYGGSENDATEIINIDLNTVSIFELCESINNTEEYDVKYYLTAEAVNGLGDHPASSVNSVSSSLVFPSVIFYSTINDDIFDTNPYTYVFGGKCFYTHRKPGTAWFDKVNNNDGWTVDFEFNINEVQDGFSPSDTDSPEGLGLYINDGTYFESIVFLPQEIYLKESKKSLIYDNTTFSRFRIIGKKQSLKIYAKKEEEQYFSLIIESKLSSKSTSQSNSGRPSVCQLSNGDIHAVWHDDGVNGRRQIMYSYYISSSDKWSDPEIIVSDVFGSSNPDICVDYNDKIYVVYESYQTDYSDIHVIYKNDFGWSDYIVLTNSLGHSINPKIASDNIGNIHVVWEDYRNGSSQIFYCKRNSSDGQWISSAAGYSDIQITNVSVGAKHPSICVFGLNVYVCWTDVRQDGTSGIFVSYYNNISKEWFSSGQSHFDIPVSLSSSARADYSDLICDNRGRLFVVYHDIVDNNYQLFARRYNSSLTVSGDAIQLTAGEYDSKFPCASIHEDSGYLYVVFQKEQDRFVNPYVPYIEDQDFYEKNSSIYLLRYNTSVQVWESSNQLSSRLGVSFGGFDVRIQSEDNRTGHRPSIPRKYSGNMHILYESEMSDISLGQIEGYKIFTCINDAVFDHTFTYDYSINGINEYNSDPYLQKDFNVSSNSLRKEIRFGDFSDHINISCNVRKIGYYLEDSVPPFNINLISSATVNMPITNVHSLKIGNKGDCYLGTENGLFYYNSNNNEIFVFDNEDSGIKDRVIYDIIIDKNGNMILGTDDGIFISNDYVYFWKIRNSSIPSVISCISRSVNNLLYVGTEFGVLVFSLDDIVSKIVVTSENYNQKRYLDITSIEVIDTSSGLVNNKINSIKIDANNIVWICSDGGLTRYQRSSKSLINFTQRNGLSSNKVLDIAIRNTAIRYIASSSGVDKMVGVNIERLDFDTINAPVASASVPAKSENEIPNFNNARSIIWKDPNLLYVCSMNEIYQITFIDDLFESEKTQIEKYGPEMYAMMNISSVQNDDLSTFNLVGVEDVEIPENAFYEVYLNGHRITNGYTFSPKYQIIKFNYPLNKYDIVKVNVRLDIQKIASFKQNMAHQKVEGYKTIRTGKLVSDGKKIYSIVSGDVNNIQINDQEEDLPFDKIILDTKPPKGKIKFEEQIDRTSIKVSIEQIDPYTPFDETSGIGSMIISNFTNFTSDGELYQDPVPFNVSYDHDLGIIFENATKQFTFADNNGSCLGIWDRSSNSSLIFAGTKNGASIYGYDVSSQEWTLRSVLDQSSTSQVHFITTYNGIIIVGTGDENGTGKIYSSSDGLSFNVISATPVKHAYTYAVLNGILYIGCGGDQGVLVSYSGNKFNTIFESISNSIYALCSSGGVLFAATGNEGRIMRLDPFNLTQQIMHVDSDSKFISIANGVVNDVSYVFAGTSESGKILRHKLSNNSFMHSFKTVNNSVYDMKNILGNVYASIGNTLMILDGVWQSKYVNEDDILSISEGPDGNVWFCSSSAVYKIEKLDSIRNVYLKLIDNAGNETNLYLDSNSSKLDPNLYVSVNIDDLIGFVNKNRIIEVDEFGNTISVYNGNDRFYSAEKIDEETGIYYSEVFNGTNNIVRWDKISLESFVPQNTGLKIYIRTALTRDELLESSFSTVFDYSDLPADISYLSGQYLQFKIVMTSKVRGISPLLRKVVIKSISSDSTHFFTTNFSLPSRISSGILTSQKIVPVAADIVFGINTTNSTDFGDYQIIEENRIFSTEEFQDGNNLRIGIRFLTPSKGETISEDFGEYGPYDTVLMNNSIDWSIVNSSSENVNYKFRISFFEDLFSSEIYSISTEDSYAGFSYNGEYWTNNSVEIGSGKEGNFSFTPTGDNPIKCNTYYFVKIEYNDGSGWKVFSDSNSFIQSCGISFIDTVDFDFKNSNSSSYFNFRVRFYTDEERTNLFYTAYSGNDNYGWFVDDEQMSSDGIYVNINDIVNVSYNPSLSSFDSSQTYYLSIDVFNGEEFINHSNSFTFKSQNTDEDIYCGPYKNVPVIKNMAIMFELDSGQFVRINM